MAAWSEPFFLILNDNPNETPIMCKISSHTASHQRVQLRTMAQILCIQMTR